MPMQSTVLRVAKVSRVVSAVAVHVQIAAVKG